MGEFPPSPPFFMDFNPLWHGFNTNGFFLLSFFSPIASWILTHCPLDIIHIDFSFYHHMHHSPYRLNPLSPPIALFSPFISLASFCLLYHTKYPFGNSSVLTLGLVQGVTSPRIVFKTFRLHPSNLFLSNHLFLNFQGGIYLFVCYYKRKERK